MLPTALVLLLGAGLPSSSTGYAFVTSAQGSGDLGSWVQAAGASGTAAGDAICQNLASAASLPDSGQYVAAISDSQNDLFCRLNGLGGTYPFCGQASPPSNAGPWQRRDGAPYASTLLMLASGNLTITPVDFDENGQFLQPPVTIFTASIGTTFLGSSSFGACSDWTAADNSLVAFGASDGAAQYWIYEGGVQCSSSQHLMCMKSGPAAALGYARRSGRVAFVSHAIGNGDLSSWSEAGSATGLGAGDAICQSEATTYGLTAPTSFKAWLSDSAQSINAIDRFQNDGAWVRTDGIALAASRAMLTSGNLISQPGLGPDGQFTGSLTLTGTTNAGLASGSDCSGWTSSDPGAQDTYGMGNFVEQWSQAYTLDCSAVQRLYCFSDLDRIFDSSMEDAPY